MADADKVKEVLDKLNDGGVINLRKSFPGIKKEILKEKIKSSYMIEDESGNSSCLMDDDGIEDLVNNILDSGKGELVNKIDSDLDQISNTLSSVVSQAPELLTQMATIPAAMIQITAVGPTVPNPIDIKNSLGQVKAQANSLSSLLSQALSKALELGISKYIPDSALTVANIISSIKNFGV